MAEERGRRARWTAALIAVPGAAALFGAATSWAMQTTPATGTTSPPTPPSSPIRTADPAVLAAQRSAAANHWELTQLQHQLAILRTQLATAKAGSRPSGTSPAVARAGQPPAPSTRDVPPASPAPPPASPAAPVPTPAAPTSSGPPAAPSTPAAPPPVQTTTGASGAAK
jgi:hypothetical protein